MLSQDGRWESCNLDESEKENLYNIHVSSIAEKRKKGKKERSKKKKNKKTIIK